MGPESGMSKEKDLLEKKVRGPRVASATSVVFRGVPFLLFFLIPIRLSVGTLK